jgi:hypothetical protein
MDAACTRGPVSVDYNKFSARFVAYVTINVITMRDEARHVLSVDKLISSLTAQSSRSSWLTCRTCGAKVKPENMDKRAAKVRLA